MKSSKTPLSTKVNEVYRVKNSDHDRIGIELELEGAISSFETPPVYWAIVDEGSLRGGVEFVTNSRVNMRSLDKALAELDNVLKKSKCSLSIRTSTHVHVNVANYTIGQVYAIIAAFYLMEDSLVKAHGKRRTGNLFCLRARDAEGIIDLLVESASQNHHLGISQSYRYGALNLNAVQKFGSVEFRFLRAITDMKLMKLWVSNLNQMCEVAAKMGIDNVINQYKRLNVMAFFRLFFTPEFLSEIRLHISSDAEVLPSLVYLQRILRKLEAPKKKRFHYQLKEDIDEFAVKDFPYKKPPEELLLKPKRSDAATILLQAQEMWMNSPPDWNVQEDPGPV